MPGKHKDKTIAFRPEKWARVLIEQRAALSGLHKKDFITRSCIYSNITVIGKKENIQRIVDALEEMRNVMNEITGQILSGDFSLSSDSYQELKEDYLAFTITVVDIVNGAAYLFDKKPPDKRQNWKTEMELEQLRKALEADKEKKNTKGSREMD
jgi:uncharacterized protein (DUF1778 family)